MIPNEVEVARAAYLAGQTPDRIEAKAAVKAALAALVERGPDQARVTLGAVAQLRN